MLCIFCHYVQAPSSFFFSKERRPPLNIWNQKLNYLPAKQVRAVLVECIVQVCIGAFQSVLTINGKLPLFDWVGFKIGSGVNCCYNQRTIIHFLSCNYRAGTFFLFSWWIIFKLIHVPATVLDTGEAADSREETSVLADWSAKFWDTAINATKNVQETDSYSRINSCIHSVIMCTSSVLHTLFFAQ